MLKRTTARKVIAVTLAMLLLSTAVYAYIAHDVASTHRRVVKHRVAPTIEHVCGPLHTVGAQIVDAQGQPVHLAGVNWSGFETQTFAPQGLNVRNYQDMLDQMAHLGFNTLRLPYSNQLFDPSSVPTGINYGLNPDLRGLQGLALMDKIVDGAQKAGLCVILDQHRPDDSNQSELWYTRQMPQSRWLHDWVMLAQHYKNNPIVIGADLHNEPHDPATWGDGNPATDWRLAAEQGGNAVLAVNPNWLIIVEGIQTYHGDQYWWGGNLEGAKRYPVVLSVPHQLVYSAHDYGPEVYDEIWFQASDFPENLPGIWQQHWAYLQQKGIAPVIVGEFGSSSVGTDQNGQWVRAMTSYIARYGMSYAYWSWSPNLRGSSGLLEKNWKTTDLSTLAILPYLHSWTPPAVKVT